MSPRQTGAAMPMKCSRAIVLSLAAALALAAAPARASGACADPACDEQQIGPYVAPDIETPDPARRFDPRGRAIPVPVPGVDAVVRHRPGAGVWIGEGPGAANLFLKPSRDRLSVDMKLDF